MKELKFLSILLTSERILQGNPKSLVIRNNPNQLRKNLYKCCQIFENPRKTTTMLEKAFGYQNRRNDSRKCLQFQTNDCFSNGRIFCFSLVIFVTTQNIKSKIISKLYTISSWFLAMPTTNELLRAFRRP